MADIPINANDRQQSYTAVGGETTYQYDWPIFENTGIRVQRTRAAVTTTLTLTTDYTVTVNIDQEANPGGQITLLSAALAADIYILSGNTVVERTTDFQQRGAWGAAEINEQFDRIVMMLQELVRDSVGGFLGTIALPLSVARGGTNATTANSALTNLTATRAEASAVAVPALNKFREVISVKDFGAVGNNTADDTSAIQAAINAAQAAFGAVVYFPAGTYKISSELSITSPVYLVGQGAAATVIRQTGAAANGVNFNYSVLTTGGGVVGMTIEAGTGYDTAGLTTSGSTGIGLKVNLANDNFIVDGVSIHNFDHGLNVLGSFNIRVSNFRILFFTTEGILIDKSGSQTGASNMFKSGKVSNFGFTGTNTNSIGIHVLATGGELFQHIDVTSSNRGVVVDPTTGKQAVYLWFDSVLADTCVTDGWLFDGTNDKVWSVQCVNCWGAFSTNGAGLITKGANLDSVRWVGGRLRENGTNGANLKGGVNVEIIGAEIAANSKASANTSAGVQVDANVSEWGIIGCRIGNFASTLTGHADNINIAAGTSANFRIQGCDLRAPGAGKTNISNGSTVATFRISNNIPITSAGNDNVRGDLATGSCVGTVAAATTIFLGCNNQQALELDTVMVAARPCIISQLIAQVNTAPGAGETFTYTVRKNSGDTTMTGQIAGAASFAVTVNTNPVTLAAGDTFDIKLVTSGGAAASKHRWTLAMDG